MEYREERKYFCSDYQLEILKHRLKAILPYDVHQKDSSYTISSLYFDTADNQCYYENSAGVDDRKKYRIRIYDHSDSNIRFEIKEKLRGKTKKSAVPITRSQCEDLIAGHFLPADNDSSVLSQIYLKEHLQFLHSSSSNTSVLRLLIRSEMYVLHSTGIFPQSQIHWVSFRHKMPASLSCPHMSMF